MCVVIFALPAAAQWPDWSAAPDATLRYDLKVTLGADHPDLGIIAMLPDGGLLPAKNPTPDVRDAEGKPIEHVIFGHNPADVMGIVFAERPSGSAVTVFFKAGNAPPPKPNTRLYPSVIYYTRSKNGSLDAAKKFQNTYPPANGTFFGQWPCVGSMVNPWGANDDFSSWYVGGILRPKKGRVYFATVSNSGSEFAIDGKIIHGWGGGSRDAASRGQQGKWLDLDEGLHRVDYYHYAARGAKTEAQIVWRGDGIQLVNTNNVPELITAWATSGETSVSGIRYRDGRASAYIRGNEKPVGYLWTGDQPVVLFSLGYSAAAPATDKVTYTWEFAKNKRISEPLVEWLVTGDVNNSFAVPVTLVGSNAVGATRASLRMLSQYTPSQCSLDNANDRQSFRKALYNMLRAVPAGTDPCADWIPDYWQLLADVIEPYRSGAMLNHIFSRVSEASLQKITAQQRYVLEDRFIETIRLQRNDKLLLDWIDKFEKTERSGPRKFRWKDERFCACLYDINDLDAAKRELTALTGAAMGPDQGAFAAMRQGDYAFFTGDLDGATKFYKEAFDKSSARSKASMPGGYVAFLDPSKRKAPTNTTSSVTLKKPMSFAQQLASKIEAWKVLTVQDASMYSTISAFLAQDATEEALQKLFDWEGASPLSKLSGEYTMAAAKTYMYMEDYRRANNILRNYRLQTTMSATLAVVMKLEMDCLVKLGEAANRPKIKELAEEFVKRFPGHPYEQQMTWSLR